MGWLGGFPPSPCGAWDLLGQFLEIRMLYIETLDVTHRHNTSARGQAREGQTRHKTHIKQEEGIW